jgi:ABC-type multidrug transport system fused ATPase/permease subunit
LNSESFILKNLNFVINPGKIFAIVGYSGAGKTTITNLIQRFYDPNNGEIFLDNYNLKDINLNYLHQNIISIVQQEPLLNSGTIEDNILYGIEEYSQEDFERICQLSNLNFINDETLFPKGFKTNVGERGAQISGGQKQRIAIARALMKESKILILDEATSALDAESENEVQKAIDNIVKNNNITIIIIAHRLSTIKNADCIMFLDKGNIIEFGTHQELIEKNGCYQKLMQKQIIHEREFYGK